jgi:hypothetical protein
LIRFDFKQWGEREREGGKRGRGREERKREGREEEGGEGRDGVRVTKS